MNSAAKEITLYEDWLERQRHLSSTAGTENPRNALQLHVFDYLISRYKDSEEAQRPARYCYQAGLVWDDRRIVVHKHLGRGRVAGVKNKTEAEERVVSVLHRLTSGQPELWRVQLRKNRVVTQHYEL